MSASPRRPFRQWIKRPPQRTIALLLTVLLAICGGYAVWNPGRDTPMANDRKTNGLWLQHGWIGHDSWFIEHKFDT
jgi:hypothetical protein